MKTRECYTFRVTPLAEERINNNKCPSCGKPKEQWTRRTDWRCCSSECTDKFNREIVIYDWHTVRTRAFIRDNYTCVKCGMKPMRAVWNLGVIEKFVQNDSYLVGDHIIPIALGGDEFDINNVQTLCKECNKIKTREDIKKIAIQRKIERLNQSTL